MSATVFVNGLFVNGCVSKKSEFADGVLRGRLSRGELYASPTDASNGNPVPGPVA
jgi:hypothetical protein